MKKHHCHSNLEGSDFNGAFTYGVSAGARTRTEGVGGLYGIQFHHGYVSNIITAPNVFVKQRSVSMLLRIQINIEDLRILDSLSSLSVPLIRLTNPPQIRYTKKKQRGSGNNTLRDYSVFGFLRR